MAGYWRGTAIALLAIGIVGGCIERRERIIVEADGWVRMDLAFKTGSFDELYLGDAVPSLEAGWLVTESVERDDEGKEIFRLEAEAGFPPEVELPATYAPPSDADGGTRLRFPTTVTIEPRADGTYYHFKRAYPARPWAHLAEARSMLEKQMKQFEGRPFEDLEPSEQALLVRGLVTYRTLETEVFVRAAFRDMLPDAPQDVWLEVRAALLASAEQIDAEGVLNRVLDEARQVDDGALEEEMAALETSTEKTVQTALRATGAVAVGELNALMRRYRWHRLFHEITDDLGDDAFEITVTMPGEIVGHNGGPGAGSSVTWKLGGSLFRDREVELMATSVVRD